MAKNATPTPVNATPPTTPDAGTTAKGKGGRPAGFSTKGSDIFKGVDPQPTGKIAPQAQQIANLVVAAGKNGITRDDLIKKMDGVVVTRQPQGRILSYYQKALIEGGFITHEEGKTTAAEKTKAKEESK